MSHVPRPATWFSHRRSRAVVLALVGLGWTVGASAQLELGAGGGSAVVEGVVTDPGGHPIVGAQVDAYLRSGHHAVYAVTDIQGRYRLSLPQRSEFWELAVSADGFFSQRTNIGVWRTRERADFVLHPDPEAAARERNREPKARRKARALMHDALEAAEKGDREKAIARLRKALDIDPTYAAAHNNLGVQLRLIGRLADAEERFRQAALLDPTDYYARFNLGSLLYDTGRYPEAVLELEEAVLVDPTSYPAALALGRAYLAVGSPRALVQLREAVRLAPEGVDLALEISDALIVAGDLVAALEAKQTWLASHAADPRADQVRETVARLEAQVTPSPPVPWAP